MKSLYIHIPFCIKKCLYCDFNSYTNLELEDEYIKALLKEVERIEEDNFETIFIGGGTPTVLSYENLNLLLNCLEKFSPKEFTVESNPGTLTFEKLRLMREKGVNRLSIGLQSTNNSILKSLGRIHSYEEFLEGYNLARKVGFNNINIDIMFGVPNQSFNDFKKTLETIAMLSPEHISAYSLIVEEGTPFYDMQKMGVLKLADEDEERKMYDYLIDFLSLKGYNWYEISNFSKKGYECEHNKVYWNAKEYYGLGAGAHSHIERKRFSNPNLVNEYIKFIDKNEDIKNIEYIDRKSAMEEFMFLGLRMINGISKKDFYIRFRENIKDVYKEQIESLTKKGLLIEDEDSLKLSRNGINISNSIFVEFLG